MPCCDVHSSLIQLESEGLMRYCYPVQAHPDVYAREEHKWDDSDLEGGSRAERFPRTLSVPEGEPCCSTSFTP